MTGLKLNLLSTILLAAVSISSDAQPLQSQEPPAGQPAAEIREVPDRAGALPPEAIRDQTRAIAKVYLVTLEVMHDRYFHGQRAMVPARAMEDVFSEVERELNIRARWIAVNTQPMSLNHEPKTDFEKQASTAIAEGKAELESSIDGTYHLAVPVPLTNSCINCHAGMFREPPKKKLFAGLILSVPIEDKGKAKAQPKNP